MGLLYKRSKLLKPILDSLEDQEGGAMYISCDVSNGGPVEPETGYVPNNPLFGLALDSPQQECAASCVGCLSCQGSSALPIASLSANDFDCGSCFDPSATPTPISIPTTLTLGGTVAAQNNTQLQNQQNSGGGICNVSNFWSTDEMASTFPGLPPLDIDPLPSLFPFSPCGASYNFSANPHQASLSYTVHPHQMLVSPTTNNNTNNNSINNNGHNQTQSQQHMTSTTHGNALSTTAANAQTCYYDAGNLSQAVVAANSVAASCGGQHLSAAAAAAGGAAGIIGGNGNTAPSIYPSMSVNVSMNMTMHGYGADAAAVPMQCSQMQWNPQNSASSVNVLYPPLLSPSHYPAAATYSFTADFRAPTLQASQNSTNLLSSALTETLEKDSPSPTVTPRSFYTSSQLGQSYSPPTKSPIYSQLRDTKSFGSGGIPFEDEDSNDDGSDTKPNLCRLCGKTYARPSTLKTHLRTHSGERPYRCPDCNKSFSQAANLTAHVRTHTGQKPFRCPICDRRFSQSSSVTTHMRTHSGERPYRCSSCKKSFSDSSTLTKHLRIHSGEKPYQCKLCLLRFSQSGNLNRHMRVHGGNTNGGNNLLT